MADKPRTFGVNDADQYWSGREAVGRTSKKRVHYFIKELVSSCLTSSGNVLICGVGDGHEYRLCAENFDTWGVELSQYAIDQYEFNTDKIVQADLNQDIPKFAVQFDAITVSMVLHWLDDPEQFLRGAKTSLTATGKLVVIIPNITHYRHRLKFMVGHFPPISLSHKNFQTPAEVEKLFQISGYKIIKRAASKNVFKAHRWPSLFATDIGYILEPEPN